MAVEIPLDALVLDLLQALDQALPADHKTDLQRDRAHGLDHGAYVAAMCLAASAQVPLVDQRVLLAAGWLHDSCNVPVGNSYEHEKRASGVAQRVLGILEWPQHELDAVVHAIETHRWPNKEYADHQGPKPQSVEAQVLRDLDELIEVLDLDRIVAMKRDYRREHGLSTLFYDEGQYRDAINHVHARAEVLLHLRTEQSEYNDIATQLLFRSVKVLAPDAMLCDTGRDWLGKLDPFDALLRAINRNEHDEANRRQVYLMVGQVLVRASHLAKPGHYLHGPVLFSKWSANEVE